MHGVNYQFNRWKENNLKEIKICSYMGLAYKVFGGAWITGVTFNEEGVKTLL
jgi:hypothetical protein